jgi:hypothetical protein
LHPTKRVHAEYFAVAIDRYPQCKLYHAHSVSLSAWLGDTLILRRTILIKQLIVLSFTTQQTSAGGANKTLLYYFLNNTKHNLKRNPLNKLFTGAPTAPPNGSALSCGAENFQIALNELSSC